MVKKSIKEIASLWKEDKRQYVKLSTFSAYALIIEKHINPVLGDKTELDEDTIQRFALKKMDEGLCRKSVKDILIVLKMIMKFGARFGLTTFSDWSVRFPAAQENRDLEILHRSDQKKIMDYLAGHFSFRNLGIYICLSTGMRIGEICGLTWKDIDMDRGIISVRRTIERIYIVDGATGHTELTVNTPKTKNSLRDIPMTRELAKLLRPLKKVVNDDFYVLSNDTKPVEPRSYRNYYKKLLAMLAIPPVKFHGLRHSFATRCIESKCDYKTVSAILGHSDISTTLNLYVHPDFEQKKRCIEQMFKGLR